MHALGHWKEGDGAELTCTLELVNGGTATGRNVQILLRHQFSGNFLRPTFSSSDDWTTSANQHGKLFGARRSLHPGWPTMLFVADWYAPASSGGPALDYRVVPTNPAPSFAMTVYCENQEPQEIVVDFDTAEMRAHPEGCYRDAGPEA
jgi:hypothetical protein